MTNPDGIFRQALVQLQRELTLGSGDEAYILNPGDPGWLAELDALSAAQASALRPPGRTTIAAHVDHVNYGITLINRWAAGEENPWATADWEASWQRGQVDEVAWHRLRADLRHQCDAWREALATKTDLSLQGACGLVASVAHLAYHIGAVRQLIVRVR